MGRLPEALQPSWVDYQKKFSLNNFTYREFVAYEENKDGNMTQRHYKYFELYYNNRTLMYTVQVFGGKPENGYPLFIGMHGGGGSNTHNLASNDSSWWDFSNRFYKKPIEDYTNTYKEGAVYVAVRGVASLDKAKGVPKDWYNLHSQPESYVLLQRMITGLFLPLPTEAWYLGLQDRLNMEPNVQNTTFVDPNRVYVLGFSAGGDGAWQMAARMPDVFAGINAGGGHPNWVPFANMVNTSLGIQCGEKDTDDKEAPKFAGSDRFDGSGVHRRADEMVKNHFQLKTLETEAKTKFKDLVPSQFKDAVDKYQFYPHNCFIVQGLGHNSWAQPDNVDKDQNILVNLAKWQEQQKNTSVTVPGANETNAMNINAVKWAGRVWESTAQPKEPRTRVMRPKFIVWNLDVRPDRPEDTIIVGPGASPAHRMVPWTPKCFMNWIYIKTSNGDSAGFKDTIRAAYDTGSNSVWVEEAKAYLCLLVKDDMLKFDGDISVYIGKNEPQKLKIKPSENMRQETLLARGDPYNVYDAMIYFEWNKDKKSWIANSTNTLGAAQTYKSML